MVAAALTRIEQEALTAPRLTALHARLTATGVPASREIQRLTRLVELLTSRHNQFFAPVALVVFWATQLAWAIDRWRIRAGPRVPDWLAALGEIEALAALGGYTAEHPEHVFPEFVDGAARLQATRARASAAAAPTRAVANDVALGGDAPHLWLVSGSNMSGKSTWLRAVGLNAVLAQAGAPVCATAIRAHAAHARGHAASAGLAAGRAARASSPRSPSCGRSSSRPGNGRPAIP